MHHITVFENSELGAVRTAEINGEPYFVGKDVAEILGYAKPLNALATHIDDDDSLKQGLIDSLGRTQETIFINESGLYSLILSSKLPNAKKFKRWVTSEVLPAIRKTGTYYATQTSDYADLDKRVSQLEMQMLENRVQALERVCDAQEFVKKEYRYAEQLPTHIRAAVDCMADNNIRLGAILDFLDDNNVWLPRRELVKYIRKRKPC